MKKTSLAKTESNRRNAQSSTGPVTAAGKAVVKQNALKHGILAKEVVITKGDARESRSEFARLLSDLASELEPVGTVEMVLVERIAVCMWRLRRAIRCEAGEISSRTQNMAFLEGVETAREIREARESLASFGSEPLMLMSSLGVESLTGFVGELRDELNACGVLGEEAMGKVLAHYGHSRYGLGHEIMFLNWLAGQGGEAASAEPGESPSPEGCRDALLQILDSREQLYAGALEDARRREADALDARIATRSIPDDSAVERILRYETTVERQLYRALNQLQEMQRARRGEAPAPTVKVALAGDQ